MLFYTGTVVLHIPEKRFWRTTPAKLNVLSAAHAEANNPRGKVAKTVEEAGFEI